ncbi:DUF3486 family protein [Variovorax sp. RKNM96]|nr:DUF3486 family protein [Variovorax sp. RKNM96]
MRMENLMGRSSKIDCLPEAQRHLARETLRTLRFQTLDHVQALLAGEGVQVSRSALHRYRLKLAAQDAVLLDTPPGLVVMLLEPASGLHAMLTTAADMATVTHAIEQLGPALRPLQQA